MTSQEIALSKPSQIEVNRKNENNHKGKANISERKMTISYLGMDGQVYRGASDGKNASLVKDANYKPVRTLLGTLVCLPTMRKNIFQ